MGYPVNRVQCKTCIFRPPDTLARGRLAEIQAYLLKGKTHLCHSVKGRACRGGRDWQLQCWSRMGIIAEPTDAALAAEMKKHGVEPPPQHPETAS